MDADVRDALEKLDSSLSRLEAAAGEAARKNAESAAAIAAAAEENDALRQVAASAGPGDGASGAGMSKDGAEVAAALDNIIERLESALGEEGAASGEAVEVAGTGNMDAETKSVKAENINASQDAN